ncbi:hypothetical protein AKJ09_11019 [Labilithrix luteola]|uniref:Uncharacterized protein n=1 Tax=Labilithrix luteola TaxID=1391654 RepID=A0A0K1QF10_9BACT|nr:hypothetical protein [Labilithrix luteola]AKV04356.1 hypothetical protein AKJ09_11019 [Labilithrix luteola]
MPTIVERDFQGFTLEFRAAYEATAAARAALSPEVLVQVNLDPREVARSVFAVIPGISPLRARLAMLPEFDMNNVDKLVTYANGLGYAQTLFDTTSAPQEEQQKYLEEATRRREVLLADAQALAKHELIGAKQLDELKGSTGYANVAADLGILVRIFRASWDRIASKTAVTPEDLDKAEGLSEYLLRSTAQRAKHPDVLAAAAEDRQRAFTLVLRAYDEVRRGISYLRWHEEDVEKIVPSLWTGRGGRRAPDQTTPNPAAPNATPANPVPAPLQTAPTGPTTAPAPKPGVGMPGSSPYSDN